MRPGESAGDHYNCKCPHCGKNNSYITDGVQVSLGEVKFFSKKCFNCKKTIYYRAEYEIKVTASQKDLFDQLRGLIP